MALDKYKNPLIVHSDMGSQYTSAEFNIKGQNYDLKHSSSPQGHPYEEVYLKAY